MKFLTVKSLRIRSELSVSRPAVDFSNCAAASFAAYFGTPFRRGHISWLSILRELAFP